MNDDNLIINFRIEIDGKELLLTNKLSIFNPGSGCGLDLLKDKKESPTKEAASESEGQNLNDSEEETLQDIANNSDEKSMSCTDFQKETQLNSYVSQPTKAGTEFDQEEMEESEEVSQYNKVDKKNVVKNYVKAFRGYLLNWGDLKELLAILQTDSLYELEKVRRAYQLYEKKKKYNNKLMKDLLLNKKFKDLFQYFLLHRAQQWLNTSSVIDKESHFSVLRFYQKAIEEPYLLSKLNSMRFKKRIN